MNDTHNWPALPRKPDALLALAALLLFYNVSALLLSPTAGMEGFEAHITSYAQNKQMHVPIFRQYTPEYDSRPGEFFLYDLCSFLYPGNVLQIAETLSIFGYALSGAFIFLLAKTYSRDAALLSLFTFAISFDFVATSTQASSVNLATVTALMGAWLFLRGNRLAALPLATAAFALSVFFRADSVLMFPTLALFLVSKRKPALLVAAALAAAFLLSFFLYKAMDVDLFRTLLKGSGKASWSGYNSDIVNIFLFPYRLPLLLVSAAGLFFYRHAIPVPGKFLFLPSLAAVSTLAFYIAAYIGKLETPRFLTFPEMVWAAVLALNFSFWPNAAATRRVVCAAFVALGVAGYFLRYEFIFNEGQRFVGFPMATPQLAMKGKVLLAKADKVIFSEIDNCTKTRPEKNIKVAVTNWGEFRRQKFMIILNGGYQVPYAGDRDGIRMIDSFAYRTKTITLFFLEPGAEYKNKDEFYGHVSKMGGKDVALFITADKMVADTLPAALGRDTFALLNTGTKHLYLSVCNPL